MPADVEKELASSALAAACWASYKLVAVRATDSHRPAPDMASGYCTSAAAVEEATQRRPVVVGWPDFLRLIS